MFVFFSELCFVVTGNIPPSFHVIYKVMESFLIVPFTTRGLLFVLLELHAGGSSDERVHTWPHVPALTAC